MHTYIPTYVENSVGNVYNEYSAADAQNLHHKHFYFIFNVNMLAFGGSNGK